MACPAVITGDAFVTRVLTHIDCQAGYLGSYGYQSLADSGSPAAILVSGLLTIFVALWGIRLLLGPTPEMRDAVIGVIKVGIVLTLAFSWPAFRTVIHDVIVDGPAEIASSISTPGLANTGTGFVARLQAADNAIVVLTEVGMGRQSGQYVDAEAPGGTFESAALEDNSSLGWARVAFLVGLIGTLALVRIGAGLLLALAPFAAGLLLIDAARGLFTGWLRGLVFALLSAVAVTFTLAIELAILEPWLADALRLRQLGYATPAAPVELLAMAIAFSMVHLALIWLIAKVSFHTDWIMRIMPVAAASERSEVPQQIGGPTEIWTNPGRAEALANQVETRVRMEQQAGHYTRIPSGGSSFDREPERDTDERVDVASPTSTSGFRRRMRNPSLSAGRRDLGQ